MTNEWLDDATARRAAYEWTEAKDEETGLRLMREVLPPLVRVRELRAVEAERNKLRARVAELEAAQARTASAAGAELTDDMVAHVTFNAVDADAACRAIAKLDELRPLGARLRMPTMEEVSALFERMSDTFDRAGTEDGYARCRHDDMLAFLRTLGADFVENAPQTDERLPDPTRPLGARLRMPTVAEANILRANLAAALESERNGEGDGMLTVLVDFLRTLGADLVESEPPRGTIYAAPCAWPAGSFDTSEPEVECVHPAPRSEPQAATSDETLRDRFAMAALAGLLADPDNTSSPAKNADVAYRLADAMLEARRRVEGEEARRG